MLCFTTAASLATPYRAKQFNVENPCIAGDSTDYSNDLSIDFVIGQTTSKEILGRPHVDFFGLVRRTTSYPPE
jgi:hypothetical protein